MSGSEKRHLTSMSLSQDDMAHAYDGILVYDIHYFILVVVKTDL